MLPDGFNAPATYPQPGYPLFLAPFAALVEPHWGLLRFVGLAVSGLMVLLTWRLARRMLTEGWAIVAALLVAINNVFMIYSGAVMPDVASAAFSLAILLLFAQGIENERDAARLAVAAGFAPLLRPEGFLLIASLCLAFLIRREFRRGFTFAGLALLPSGLWALRNYQQARTASGYFSYWATMCARWDARSLLIHALRVAATYFGEGLLGLVGLPFPALLAFGLASWALMAYGASRQLRGRGEPWVAAMAVYMAGVALLHLAWQIEVVRYLLAVLPIAWIFLLKGATALFGRRRALAASLALFAAGAALRLDASPLREKRPQAAWLPATTAWIRAHVPPDARLQSDFEGSVMLWTGRPAIPFFDVVLDVDHWLGAVRWYRVKYVLFTSAVKSRQLAWLLRRPQIREVYRDASEGTVVLAFEDSSASASLRRGMNRRR